MLQLINRARSDPAAEGRRLMQVARTDPAVAAMTQGWNLNTFMTVISSYGAEPPLAFQTGLIEAARDHSATMLATNDQRHSPAGYLTDPTVAQSDAGGAYYPVGLGTWATAENIFAYSRNVVTTDPKAYVDYFHAGFLLDWGNPDFGHLKNLLAPGPGGVNAGQWPLSEIGIGLLTDTSPTAPPPSAPTLKANFGLQVGPAIVTQEFAWRNGPAALTGVVYRDNDADHFYSPGEGLGGVTILAVGRDGQGTFQAQTWGSGGYTLELPAGSYEIDATDAGHTFLESTTVTIGVDNVGWDVVPIPTSPRSDQPVPADYDGDGRVDLAVFRPASGQWSIQQSTGGLRLLQLGTTNRDLPIPADYDGDGRVDPAVFRPDTAQWTIQLSTGGLRTIQFGMAGHDLPIPADYDGDGQVDLALFRPSTAQWIIRYSAGGALVRQFGMGGHDLPIPADYDGDGQVDLALFRPSTAQWIIRYSAGGALVRQFGMGGHDLPIPADYDGDGQVDLALFRPSTAQWIIRYSAGGALVRQFGMAGHDLPIPADYDDDGQADMGIVRPSTAQWALCCSRQGSAVNVFGRSGLGRLPEIGQSLTIDGFARFAAIASITNRTSIHTTTVQDVPPTPSIHASVPGGQPAGLAATSSGMPIFLAPVPEAQLPKSRFWTRQLRR